jgi:hypothetical protein
MCTAVVSSAVSTSISWVLVYKISRTCWMCWFLMSFYLESWGLMRWIQQRNSIKFCCSTAMRCLILPFSLGNFWPKTTRLSSLTHPTFLYFLDWR